MTVSSERPRAVRSLQRAALALARGVGLLIERCAHPRRRHGVPAPREPREAVANEAVRAAIVRAAEEARNPWMAAALRAHADAPEWPDETPASRSRRAADRERALWFTVRLG